MRFSCSAVMFVALCAFSILAQTSVPDLTAAAAGDVRAQVALARVYEKGDGVAQNDELAAKWYRAAAEKGDPEAQNSLGVLYRLGRGVEQDKAAAVEWYRKAAKQGYAPAMFNLGAAFYNGDGTGIDDSLAYAWFTLAERAGSKEAPDARRRMENELSSERLALTKLRLANMVLYGQGVAADPPFAFSIVRELAEKKEREAVATLGVMYANGFGTAADPALAVKLLGDSGLRWAQEYLADMYLQGRGVPKDGRKAVEIYSKLSEIDYGYKVKLADLYWNGQALPPDHKLAVKNYEAAASHGNGHALYQLGLASRDGLGAKKDAESACMYFVLGNTVGDENSKTAATQVCTPSMLQRVKKKASAWFQSHPNARWAVQDQKNHPSPAK